MKTKNQNPAQYEWGPFPFGDGTSIYDIRYDPVFKTTFTRDSSNSRAALSDLISSLIGRTVSIKTINANEPPIYDLRQRYVRFDIVCRTEKGEHVNVEMSFNPDSAESVRLEYHASRLFVGQDLHGKDKNYSSLKECYQIAILAKMKLFSDKNLTHNFLYYDPAARVSLKGKTRIITVELAKTKPIANKSIKEMTNAEQWAVFFQYLTDQKKRSKIIEIINHEEGIAMAVKTLGTLTQKELDYIRESSRLKSELDWQSHMTNAKLKGLRKGLREGRKRGRIEGRMEGRNEGLLEGRKEGHNEANIENARRMKADNMPVSQICKYTGLSEEIIATL